VRRITAGSILGDGLILRFINPSRPNLAVHLLLYKLRMVLHFQMVRKGKNVSWHMEVIPNTLFSIHAEFY
jgi:hypothetical protein